MALLGGFLVQLSLISLLVYLVIFVLKRRSLARRLSWVPGPPALPLLGNFLEFCLSSHEERFEKMMLYKKKYGDIYKIWMGPLPVIMCHDPELVQKIFRDDQAVVKSDQFTIMGKFIGDGLVTLPTDDKWKIHRKFLSNSFHMELYEAMTQQTWQKALHLANFFKKYVDKGETIELIEHLKPLIFDLAMLTSTGLESNTLEKEDSREFLDIVERFSDIVMTRTFIPLLKYDLIYNLTSLSRTEMKLKAGLDRIAREIIIRRKKILEQESNQEQENNIEEKRRKIVLDNLFELNKSHNRDFSDLDVESEIITLLFAAYDTLATSVSFALYVLGHHPEYQEKLVRELDTYAPNCLSEGITLQDLSKLDLLDRCLKEAMRLYPVGAVIGRTTISPVTIANGTIPPGVDVYLNFYAHHRNEEVFPDSEKFDPDRFLPSEIDKRDPLTYVPFGVGSRICIGQKQAIIQTKIMVAIMLKKYFFTPVERREDLKLMGNIVLKSKTGLKMILKER